MLNFVRRHKAAVLAGGILIQICGGIPAAWGVFQQSVREAYRMSRWDTAMVQNIVVCFFGVGCVTGGAWQDKKGPRPAAVTGAVLLGAGFMAAALAPAQSPWLFYALFSVPVGTGCALLYPSVMCAVQAWYADKIGLATGIIGGAVGLSGAVLTLSWGVLNRVLSVRGALAAMGAGMWLLCLTGAAFMVSPDACRRSRKSGAAPRQMLRTPHYYALVTAVALCTPSVLLFSPVIIQLCTERGVNENLASLSIILGSVSSALGRLLLPWLGDRIGRTGALMLPLGGLAAASTAFIFAQGWWFIAVYCTLTFFYSGFAAVLPSAATALYGEKHSGQNYGLLALGLSAGSVGFGLLARSMDTAWVSHTIAVAAPCAGLLLLIPVCRYEAKHKPGGKA